jgi:hypothetical protein
VQASGLQPRWDQINSAAVIGQARRIYFLFLERCASSQEPLGIVISNPVSGQGRVVFELPVLLPEEHFIPLELVRGRQGRSRTSRSPYRG